MHAFDWRCILIIMIYGIFVFDIVCLSICLFGVYRPTRDFHSFGDVTIAGEGLQILTYAPNAHMVIE